MALERGDDIPDLKVTPDRYLPNRYAGASGDFNPIHIDPEFARQVGLPGAVLHGLYSMGLAARAVNDLASGDPRALNRLSVQFRGMGVPESELTVAGTVANLDDRVATIDVTVSQNGKQIIKNAEGDVLLPPSEQRVR